MAEPITTTVIVTLAATKFIEGVGGELSKRFTPAALEKMSELWGTIKKRFRGKKPNAETAIAQIERGDKAELENLAKYLDVEMLDDTNFADEVRSLAREIQIGKIQDNSSMQLTSVGDNNTNIQAKAEQGGTNYNAHSITVNNNPSQP